MNSTHTIPQFVLFHSLVTHIASLCCPLPTTIEATMAFHHQRVSSLRLQKENKEPKRLMYSAVQVLSDKNPLTL